MNTFAKVFGIVAGVIFLIPGIPGLIMTIAGWPNIVKGLRGEGEGISLLVGGPFLIAATTFLPIGSLALAGGLSVNGSNNTAKILEISSGVLTLLFLGGYIWLGIAQKQEFKRDNLAIILVFGAYAIVIIAAGASIKPS